MSRDSRPSSPANATPDTRQRTGQFFSSVASLFESWVTRRKSAHTQRAYREDVMSFVQFLGIEWPDQAMALLSVSVRDVLAFREQLLEKNAAPKTINRRIFLAEQFLQIPGRGCG
jgi:site-specific recombinase XerD